MVARASRSGITMKIRIGSKVRLPVATVAAFVVFVAVGLVVGIPSLADATAMPTLSVSPSSAAVGEVVAVQFGPAGNGCGTPVFESSAGSNGGYVVLPYVGVGGSVTGISGVQDFVIPRTLTSPSTAPNVPVSPGSYKFSLTCDTSNAPATAQTVSVSFTVTAPNPQRFVGIAPSATGGGYWIAQAGGGVRNFGQAIDAGNLPSQGITPYGSVVGIASNSDGKGYWLTGTDGGVFSFGDAHFLGSIGGETLNQPVVGMASTPDGKGYWLVASDGGVFSFGDAHYFGSMGGEALNQPVVGMASTPDGKGYWLVASDGGVFSFGDAHYFGSMGGEALNQPIVGISGDPSTGGYWEVAADGGVFAFGAPFYGSTGNVHLNQPIVAIAGTASGLGYRFAAADGGIFDFGDAQFFGSAA
jgi:hypothetical protein